MLLRILDRLEEILIARADGGRDAAHLRRRRAPLPGRRSRSCIRYLFRINLAWSQELCIYMFIWMAKFGAAYGVRTGIHVGVDVLINRLSRRWRKGVILFGLLGGALFTAIVGTMGAEFVIELMAHRPDLARSRNAELDRLCLHPARLLPDVLPLPAGGLDLLAAPASCRTTTPPMSTASR